MAYIDLPQETIPEAREIRKKFLDHFESFAYGYNYDRAFEDLLDLTIFKFSNLKYEAEYLEIVKKYNPDKIRAHLPYLWQYMTEYYQANIINNKSCDLLGDLYQFLASSYKQSGMGQFFTPLCVTDFMSQIVSPDTQTFCNEPCSGSARMIISTRMNFPENEIYWIAQDLDRICCKMSVINMYFYGCIGSEVFHCDALWPDNRLYAGWRIGLEPVNEAPGKPYVDENGKSIWFPSIMQIDIKTQMSKQFMCASVFYEAGYNQIMQERKQLERIKKSFELMKGFFASEPEEKEIEPAVMEKAEGVIIHDIQEIIKEAKIEIIEEEIIKTEKDRVEFANFKKSKKFEEVGQLSLFV